MCTSDSVRSTLAPLLAGMRRRADDLDQSGAWPEEDFRELAAAGVMGWAVPREFGGAGVSALDQHLGYEIISAASLNVALILSQRDSAVGLIEAGSSLLRSELLAALARNDVFTTVGIAQLTTSRQGGPPALRASREPDGYRLDGLIPWCTGAAKARWIVAGAATEDRRQLLFLLPHDAVGVTIDPPMPLAALRSSWTASLRCGGVEIDEPLLLRGPAEKVIVRSNDLPLRQAFQAIGLCRGALDLIAAHNSAAASKAHQRLESQLVALRDRVLALSQSGREAEATAAAPEIRGQCNDLALRITHAAVALYKGAALLAGHPAQRLAREALFLLVWSCPNPVIDCTIDLLSA